jgi:DNA-binding CsgD family transcriptional regulator
MKDMFMRDKTADIEAGSNIIVFLTGITYSLLFTTTVILIYEQQRIAGDGSGYLLTLAGTCSALILLIASRNIIDMMDRNRNRMLLLGISVLLIFISATLVLSGQQGLVSRFFVTVSLTAALCIDTLLWLCCLSIFEHRRVLILFDICFGMAALGILVSFAGTVALAAAIIVEESLFALAFMKSCDRLLESTDFPSEAKSRKNNQSNRLIRMKSPPLMAVGILAGFPITYTFIYVEHDALITLMTLSLVLAGVLFGFIRLNSGYRLENFFFRYTPVFFCLGEFLLPFTSGMFRLVCLGYLLTFAFIQILIVTDAIIESARLFKISPIWLMSTQATSVLIGFIASLLVTIIVNAFLNYFTASIIETLIVAFLVVFLTCFVPRSGYPGAKILTKSPVEEIDYRPRWCDVLDSVASDCSLSPREREVLDLLAKGHTTTVIAQNLYISTATIRTHVAKIYSKMDVHSKEELLDYLQEERNRITMQR